LQCADSWRLDKTRENAYGLAKLKLDLEVEDQIEASLLRWVDSMRFVEDPALGDCFLEKGLCVPLAGSTMGYRVYRTTTRSEVGVGERYEGRMKVSGDAVLEW
jgi:hypothetical protein